MEEWRIGRGDPPTGTAISSGSGRRKPPTRTKVASRGRMKGDAAQIKSAREDAEQKIGAATGAVLTNSACVRWKKKRGAGASTRTTPPTTTKRATTKRRPSPSSGEADNVPATSQRTWEVTAGGGSRRPEQNLPAAANEGRRRPGPHSPAKTRSKKIGEERCVR